MRPAEVAAPAQPLPVVCPACGGGLAAGEGGLACGGCAALYPEEDGIVRLVTGREGAAGYDDHYFDSLPQVEDRHFWFTARREVILQGLRRSLPDLGRRPLFDVGCGTGGLLSFLERSGVPVAGGCDAHARGLHLARRRLQAPLFLVDEGRVPALAAGQRLLSLFDVLEHLDDDLGVLRWAAATLAPGGALALTVPAHPFLFDEMDVRSCHRRRYRRGELRAKLEAAGLEPRLLTSFMAPLMPLLVTLRSARRLVRAVRRAGPASVDAELRVVPVFNGLMGGVLALERRLLRHLTLPFGTSLLVVAVKRDA